MMRIGVVSFFSLCLFIGAASAYAAGPNCADQAMSRKLAGAAQTSFMRKCERDATASCDASAKARKLGGAAKASFTRKCVADARGR
jgi:hypothetical protein